MQYTDGICNVNICIPWCSTSFHISSKYWRGMFSSRNGRYSEKVLLDFCRALNYIKLGNFSWSYVNLCVGVS